MKLEGRRSTARHEHTAMNTEVYWDFKPKERVQTIDGVLGTVVAVWDGPFPGTESYEVKLDNNLGGGEYTASQLSKLRNTTAVDHTSEYHLASDDYDELMDVLQERPDIAKGHQ